MEIEREQYLDYMTGRRVERPIFSELFGCLVGLPEEWRAQGASEAEISLEAFGFDYVKRHRVVVHTGILDNGYSEKIIEETDEHLISLDRYGRRMKLCKRVASIPLPENYPVSDWDSWLQLKPRYEFLEERFSEDRLEQAVAAYDVGA